MEAGGSSQCAYGGGTITFTLPNNTMTNATPAGGIPILCNGAGDCPIGFVTEFYSDPIPYVISSADDNTTPVDCFGAPSTAGDNLLTFRANYSGTSYFINAGQTVIDCRPLAVQVTIPSIQVGKQVACKKADESCGTFGAEATGYKVGLIDPGFCYSITITNDGNVAAQITNVTDNAIGTLLSSPTNLAVGAVLVIETNVTHGVSVENTVTVTGVTATSPTLPVQDTANAKANVFNPSILCSNLTASVSQLFYGQTTNVTFGVTVKNTGNTPLNGVAITSDKCTTGITPFSLAAGVSTTRTFVCSVTMPTAPEDCPWKLNVSIAATTTGECPVEVTSGCDVSIGCQGNPQVCITKEVACLYTNGCGAYAPAASGVKSGTNCPTFCYRVTVTNCGDEPLVGLTYGDTVFNMADCLPALPTSLDIGGSQSCTYQMSLCTGVENIVSVTGTGAFSGIAVSDVDTAKVDIAQAKIGCQKWVSLDGTNWSKEVTIDDDGADHTVWYKITVSNLGAVKLNAISVTELVATDLQACIDPQVPVELAVGEDVDIVCEAVLNCTNITNGALVNTVEVYGKVAVETEDVCAYDMFGQVIDDSSQCSATVTCKPIPQEGCRTTGGGKQYAIENQTCPKDVRYVTHGGQVGAPYGAAGAPEITNCETGEGTGFWNACIRGEYQHVRHMKGGRRANFHAASNGNVHQFDSLACACLPCDQFETSSPWADGNLTCHPADRTYTNLGDTATVEGLCNPGDRACGPEPRKAPANKIAFSGVGSYTESKGKKVENSVVFRVDIEDRGEPGNAHSISRNGKNKKIDRYRMRMWKITGDPDSLYNRALRVAVAVTDAADERVLAELPCGQGPTPEPDIDDGGDLDRGNRQIHPNTGATCK